MIPAFLSRHVAPAFVGTGAAINIIHYAFDRVPYVSVGAGLALVLVGFLVWAIFSED